MNAPSDFASSQHVVPSYATIEVKQNAVIRSKVVLKFAITDSINMLARLPGSFVSSGQEVPWIACCTESGLIYLSGGVLEVCLHLTARISFIPVKWRRALKFFFYTPKNFMTRQRKETFVKEKVSKRLIYKQICASHSHSASADKTHAFKSRGWRLGR
jgi:hypothetical protein